MDEGHSAEGMTKLVGTDEIAALAREFEQSQGILTVLGDETRQHLILAMMQSGSCTGLRVNEIAQRTSLSRPAVSHHLRIMKDAGLVKVRKEGTKNFYYFDESASSIDRLVRTLQHASRIMRGLPDRSEA
jgi:ArsR family transcriptional regulator